MWMNRMLQPATNIFTLSPRLARSPRPAIASWRRYTSTNREALTLGLKLPMTSATTLPEENPTRILTVPLPGFSGSIKVSFAASIAEMEN